MKTIVHAKTAVVDMSDKIGDTHAVEITFTVFEDGSELVFEKIEFTYSFTIHQFTDGRTFIQGIVSLMGGTWGTRSKTVFFEPVFGYHSHAWQKRIISIRDFLVCWSLNQTRLTRSLEAKINKLNRAGGGKADATRLANEWLARVVFECSQVQWWQQNP